MWSECEAWEYLAWLFDNVHRYSGGWLGPFGPVYGICVEIDDLLGVYISLKTADDMKSRLPCNGSSAYCWPLSQRGHGARVAFCRKMAEET